MNELRAICRLNIPELFDLPDAGLDDAGVDGAGNLLVSDGSNGRVYRLSPLNEFDVLPVIRSAGSDEKESSLNIAVGPDSSFCVSDARREIVVRYGPGGEYLGEFTVPGVLTICRGPECLYALCVVDNAEEVGIYDELGFMVDRIIAPPRHQARLDPSVVSMDSDPEGNVFLCYGVPPYQIWKVTAEGCETWRQDMDYPDQAILVADIAVDASSGTLWALLACKKSGRQVLDAFSLDGGFVGTYAVPHSETLYGVICPAGDSEFYLLDTGTGPGSGELLRVRQDI